MSGDDWRNSTATSGGAAMESPAGYVLSWFSLVQFSVNNIVLNPVRICVVVLLYLVLYLLLALLLTLLLGTIRTYILQHAKAVLRHQDAQGTSTRTLSTPHAPALLRTDSDHGAQFGTNQAMQSINLQSPWTSGVNADNNRRPIFPRLGIFTPHNEGTEQANTGTLGYRLTQERSTNIDDFGWNIGLDGTWKSLLYRCKEERFSPLILLFGATYLYFLWDWTATWRFIRQYLAPMVKYMSTSSIVTRIIPQGFAFVRDKGKDFMAQLSQMVGENVTPASERTLAQISVLTANLNSWFHDIVSGIWEYIQRLGDNLVSVGAGIQESLPDSIKDDLGDHMLELVVTTLALIALLISFFVSSDNREGGLVSPLSSGKEETPSHSQEQLDSHKHYHHGSSTTTKVTSNVSALSRVDTWSTSQQDQSNVGASYNQDDMGTTSFDSNDHSGVSSESSHLLSGQSQRYPQHLDGADFSSSAVESANPDHKRRVSQPLQISSCQSVAVPVASETTSTVSGGEAQQTIATYHEAGTAHSSTHDTRSSADLSADASNEYQQSEVGTAENAPVKPKDASDRLSQLDRQSSASSSVDHKAEENNDGNERQQTPAWNDFGNVDKERASSLETSRDEQVKSSDQYSSGRSSSYWDSMGRESGPPIQTENDKRGHRKSRSQPAHVFLEEALHKSGEEQSSLISHFDAVPAVASPYHHQRTSTTPAADRHSLFQLSSDASSGHFELGHRDWSSPSMSPKVATCAVASDYVSRQSSSRTVSSGPEEVSSDDLKSENYYPKARERRGSEKVPESNRYSSALPPRKENYHSQEHKPGLRAAGIRSEQNSQTGRGGASSVSTSMLSTLSAKERRRASRNERRSNLSGEISNILGEGDAERLKQVFKEPETDG